MLSNGEELIPKEFKEKSAKDIFSNLFEQKHEENLEMQKLWSIL